MPQRYRWSNWRQRIARLFDFADIARLGPKIITALRKHPNHVISYVGLFTTAGLLAADVEPFYAVGGPSFIILALFARECFSERHKERMAEARIQQLEKSKGRVIRQRARRELDKIEKKP